MGPSHNAHHRKVNSLNIRLTESAVFLPVDSFAPTPRRRNRIADTRTSTLRGLLVLELVKPTKISSIAIELSAVTSTAWPEGIGARRIDVTEDHSVFHASTVFFSGSKSPQRRTASIGPGVHYARFSDDPEAEDELTDETEENSWELLRARSRAPASATEPLAGSTEAGPSRARARAPAAAPAASTSSHASGSADVRPSFAPPEPRLRPAGRPFSVDAPHYRPRPPYETLHRLQVPAYSAEPPIPPYSPFPDSPEPTSALSLPPASPASPGPAQSLEEFRNSLRSTLLPPPAAEPSPAGSASSLASASHAADGSSTRHAGLSLNDIDPPPRARPAARRSSHSTPLAPIPAGDAVPSSPSAADREKEREHRGRKRFSLTSIFKHAVPKAASRERAGHHEVPQPPLASGARRDASVEAERERRSGRRRSSDFDGVEEEDMRRHRSKERGRGVIGRIIKGDLIDAGRENEDWTEFKPGTYSYPISFSIPSDAPPTMRCEFGSVVWQLKAQVRRPGAFKTKLTATRDVDVIACPTEEDTEDTENIIVERQWESQLQYIIAVSGRSFHIGGTMPVMFTLMPLSKMKIFRLSIFIEERVDYYTNMRRVARSDLPTSICLLSIRGGKGESILPLDSDSPDALRASPLFPLLAPGASDSDLSEVASTLMGPGPWTFQKNLPLPKSCDELRFTNHNRRSNIAVAHMLKVVMRVQRGDDMHVDPKTGKRKLFDIVVQTPVIILSCRCNPEWMGLPRYAEALEDASLIVPSCPCQEERARILAGHGAIPHGGFLERMTSRRSSDSSGASAAETTPGHTAGGSGTHAHGHASRRLSSYTDAILQSSSLFERLVSGRENARGEVPPAYDPATRASIPGLAQPQPPRAMGVSSF